MGTKWEVNNDGIVKVQDIDLTAFNHINDCFDNADFGLTSGITVLDETGGAISIGSSNNYLFWLNQLVQPASGRTITITARLKHSGTGTMSGGAINLTVDFPPNADSVGNGIWGNFQNTNTLRVYTKHSGLQTETISSPAVNTHTTYREHKLVINGVTSVQYFVDGTLVATNTTNITTSALRVGVFSFNQGTTVDFIRIQSTTR